MSSQAFNPYLPAGEYIPDAEPYVFGDRVYIYGSHDRFGAPMFCVNDYVTWSAPVGDLSDWRYEGVIYRKNQDPKNRLGLRLLFAPDVTVGPDGRYYLYYAFDFMGLMGVAVADHPAGPFEFHGHVHYPDGTLWGRRKGDSFPFDPGVLVDDDNRVYLYSGFYTPVPAIATGGRELGFDGGYVLELEADMVTIKTPEKLLFPKSGPGSFAGHEFFEASSMRKYDDRYYFVYSSRLNHELCYAVSDRPTEGFEFGGTLVSIGDVGLEGHTDEKTASNYTGNTHGGMLRIGDDFYTFYHRQTNRSSYARQACAEKLEATRDERGVWRFAQAEVTSCGLNGGPLRGKGIYEACIACNLWSADGAGRYDGSNPKKRLAAHPYFTQDRRDVNPAAAGATPVAKQYIANMRDGAVAGFKYFDGLDQVSSISVTVRTHKGDGARGPAQGVMRVSLDPDGGRVIAEIPVRAGESAAGEAWGAHGAPADPSAVGDRPSALYFTYRGEGSMDFQSFELN
ncbi:glycosyl hydrolase, family 43 [Bifidobacterium lemurum]|uniref:Glycosyl hydrolase, family 43 n=1 Tax=Bifidobacterium lemurum TaxID=1603886 RepID=A0A261FVB1_9BIFI|nr:family 43 glycosylhydrolase [Bifidobacterium lemurum]OZG62873.1 glycosyl hydrolase, family 43 [Bifidobacterium lemurum]QOL35198.1 family 43 glycosylhydrolase [Bifidobacterium lemurum]